MSTLLPLVYFPFKPAAYTSYHYYYYVIIIIIIILLLLLLLLKMFKEGSHSAIAGFQGVLHLNTKYNDKPNYNVYLRKKKP